MLQKTIWQNSSWTKSDKCLDALVQSKYGYFDPNLNTNHNITMTERDCLVVCLFLNTSIN